MSDQIPIRFDGPQGLTPLESKVLALIQRGRENAISMPSLASAVDLTTRELQDVVKHLIEDHGVLILSACGRNHGYYLPASEEEYRAGVDQLKHRIISLAKRIRAIDRQAYEEIFGQTSFIGGIKHG